MIDLLSLFGLDAQLRKIRALAGEGALALEDRFQLARVEWEEEKHRLKLLLACSLAMLGLTVVALTIASLAVIVHFWETPARATATWSIAAVWLVLWLGVGLAILLLLRRSATAFEPTREELAKDWSALKNDMVPAARKASARDALGEVNKQVLLERIARQRERLSKGLSNAPHGATANSQLALAQGNPATSNSDPTFPRSATIRALRDHPVASIALLGGTAAIVIAAGPRRIARVASWVMPLLR